jgi:S1-C subfamily serine protease
MRIAARLAVAVVVAVAVDGAWASPTISARADFQPISAERAARVLRDSTVEVQAFGCDLQRRDGSGVAVAPGRVLTNAHVVRASRLVDVATDTGPTAEADVPAVASAGDVAEVSGDLRVPALELSPRDPGPGASVWVAGFPSSGAPSSGPGLVVATERVIGSAPGGPFGQPWPVLRLSGGVARGMSGGPVLDSSGRLAGIVFGDEIPTGQALAIPASALRRALSASPLVPSACS